MKLYRKNICLKGQGPIMENTINVTQKLLKIVKQRKTPIVVYKQESGYKRNSKINGNLAHESYSYGSDE